MWIKRDDLSSFDLSGNKVRKLEFLMAAAVASGHDSIITIGGQQSNHARATACCSKQLGLESHLILRCPDPEKDPGLAGNLLLNRLVGANIYTVSPGTYARIGSAELTAQLAEKLRAQGKNPYVVPVGGSNELGAWGYIEFVRELIQQCQDMAIGDFDHIIFACGSGGTATGIALGLRLSGIKTKVHAVGVCDSPVHS